MPYDIILPYYLFELVCVNVCAYMLTNLTGKKYVRNKTILIFAIDIYQCVLNIRELKTK